MGGQAGSRQGRLLNDLIWDHLMQKNLDGDRLETKRQQTLAAIGGKKRDLKRGDSIFFVSF